MTICNLKMLRSNGTISLLLKMIILTASVMLSEGVDSSSICPGKSNYVTSSENYTEVHIDRSLRPNESCTWVIESGACYGDSGVEVEIYTMRFTGEDSVTIYDGPSSRYPVVPLHDSRWDNIGNLPSKRSSGRYITVVFLFKFYHFEREFSLRYRNSPIGRFPSNTESPIIENSVSDTCMGEVLLAFQKPNLITSPGNPSKYHNRLNCKWTVMSDDKCNNDVIQVTIHSLSLNGSDDHLIIFDGDSEFAPVLVKLSGQVESQVIMSTGTTIVIEFNTDDAATGQGFSLSYTRTSATPLLAEQVSINITDHTVVMAVEFKSGTPHRAVYWSRNGVVIPQDAKHTITVNPALVKMEPNVSSDGFRATLTITGPGPSDFGRYKVAVVNGFGVSERVILLPRGNSVPVIQSHAVFPENASITVTFSSHPIFKIEWYKRQRFLHFGSKMNIQNVTTERLGDNYNGEENEALFKSVLSSANPTESDYGDYMCIIKNDIGTTEISFDMSVPGTELPKVLVPSPTVEINEQDIILSVNFDSNLVHPSATWYIGEVEIESSDKYTMELTWEGIASSDWFMNGYPSLSTSQDLERVSVATDYQSGYMNSYTYPSIGSSRSSTQPNSNYTAMLTISKMTLEDFGSYRVVLENEAGKSHYVIEVPTPEVFPYVTCDQADTIQLVCNVTSCPSVTQSWIHSVNGEVIRKLSGHQDGPINTLTIPLCMYPDAGTYTCVATDIKSGNNVKLYQGKTTLVVKAVPVILEPTIDIQSDGIQIEVPFFSHPPYRWVTWHRGGIPFSSSLSDILETGPRDVILPMYGKMSSQAGNVTSINVPGSTTGDFEEFGIYKLTIGNEMGSSVHYIDVQNPLYANPVVSSDVRVSMSGASAILIVNFLSYHPYLSVKWYFRGEEVKDNQPVNRYEIQTTPSHDVTDPRPPVKHSDSTILTITSVSEEDYGMYKVIVSNDAGQAVIPVTVTVHGEGLPKIVGEVTAVVSNSTGELSAIFYPSTSYGFIRWLKQDKEITTDLSKYVIINEAIDIQILLSGETVVKSGTKTRLRVTSLNDKDYGRYSEQIYNDAGMTERSTTLQKECT